jgi:cytochrome b
VKEKVLIWDLPVRAFHWLLAGSFAGAWLLAETEKLRNVHVMFGYTVLGLLAFRVAWGFLGSRYARFSSFAFAPRQALAYVVGLLRGRAGDYAGHNPAGSLAIWAIFGLAALAGITGYATYNEIGGDALEEFHEFVTSAWLVVVGLHVAGVLVSSLLHRENLAAAMLSGYKRAERAAAIGGTYRALGIVVVAAVGGFWLWTLSGPRADLPADAMAARGQVTTALVAGDGDD